MIYYRLVCGHSGSAKVLGDEEEWCATCEKWVDVDHRWPEQWWSSCPRGSVGECATRAHGNAKVYAERRAALHLALTGHVMRLTWRSGAPKSVTKTLPQKALFDLPTDPPF